MAFGLHQEAEPIVEVIMMFLLVTASIAGSLAVLCLALSLGLSRSI